MVPYLVADIACEADIDAYRCEGEECEKPLHRNFNHRSVDGIRMGRT
jgi:hypothetical protein